MRIQANHRKHLTRSTGVSDNSILFVLLFALCVLTNREISSRSSRSYSEKDLALIDGSLKTNAADPACSDFVIVGDGAFQQQVRTALTLLMYHDQDDFLKIKKYLREICQANHSGTQVSVARSTFYLAPQSAFYSVTWCAGDLVHEACHCKLYRDYWESWRFRDSNLIVNGKEAEKYCIKQQLKALEKIRAPVWERNWLRAQDGSHHSTPYADRNW